MAKSEEISSYSDRYWEDQVRRSEVLAARKSLIDPEAAYFWGMCIFTGLAILFGPTVLAMLGIIS